MPPLPPLHYVLVFLLPLLAYSPALHGDFVFDDLPALVNNPDLKSSSLLTSGFSHDFWGNPMDAKESHKSYRPLTILTFRLLGCLSNKTASVFHLANLLLHSANCCLVLRLSKTLLGRSKEAFTTALVFALHPVHSESVAACVGLADLSYSALFLSCVYIYTRNGLTSKASCAILLLSSLAVLFKEQGIMTVPTIVALDAIRNLVPALRKRSSFCEWKKHLKKYFVCLLYLCVVVYLRLWIMNFERPVFQRQDNPAAFMVSRAMRWLNQNYHYAVNAWLLLAPDSLCFDWSMGCIDLIESVDDRRVAFVLVLWAAVLSALFGAVLKRGDGWKKEQRMILCGLTFVILPFLPSSNILFTVGFVIAERSLYLTVLGSALLLALGQGKLKRYFSKSPSARCLLDSLYLLTLACFSLKAFTRAMDWRTEDSLFKTGLRVCPRNAKVHYNIAKLAADRGDLDLSVREYGEAIQLHPRYGEALNNLGNVLKHRGKYHEAEELLRRAVDASEKFPAAWMNLGIVLVLLGRFDEAESSYLRALEQKERYGDCHYNLGNLYLKTGRRQDALSAFSKAIEIDPGHKSAWANLVNLADDLELFDLAGSKAAEAMERFPHHSEFYFHLANVYGKLNRFEEAETLFRRALELKESSSLYYGNLGVLYHKWEKYDQARECYEKALWLDADNLGARRNLDSLSKKVLH